jgi:hypothetical protein
MAIYDPNEEFTKDIASSVSDDISNDDLTRLIQERWMQEHDQVIPPDTPEHPPSEAPTPPPDLDQPAAEPATEEPQTAPEVPPSSTPPESIDFGDGLKLDREQARIYAEFHQFLQDNPEFAEVSRDAWIKVQKDKEEPPTPIVPEELDLDDPNVKFLWDQLQSTRQDLDAALQRITSSEAVISTQAQATTESLVNRAVASFQKQHDLSPDQMNQIRGVASRLEVLPSLMAPVDPITGQARKVDPLAAIESALDTAYWSMPEYRDAELERLTEQRAADDKRKRNLSSLGGSSGSVPRTPPKPQTKEELRQAMVAEITEAMFGPSQSNEE